jgi:hypothetical protein
MICASEVHDEPSKDNDSPDPGMETSGGNFEGSGETIVSGRSENAYNRVLQPSRLSRIIEAAESVFGVERADGQADRSAGRGNPTPQGEQGTILQVAQAHSGPGETRSKDDPSSKKLRSRM